MQLPQPLEQMLKDDPHRHRGKLRRLAAFQIALWRHCLRRLRALNAMMMSAALSFRTIFALIPLIVLAFLVVKAVGVLPDSRAALQQVLKHFGLTQIKVEVHADPWSEEDVPTTGPAAASAGPEAFNAAGRIEEAVLEVERKLNFTSLGPVGVVLIVWAAITLLTTTERSLNRIFQATRERPTAMRVLVYWSMITLVPIVLAAATYLGGLAIERLGHVPVLSVLVVVLDIVSNLIAGILMIACVYKFMPSTPVSFRSALLGAGMMVPLWLVARWAFGLYVGHVGKNSLYGALGLLPLFMLWLNFCWYIFLLGAEIAHTSMNLRQMIAEEQSEHVVLGPMEALAAAVVVADRFARGAGPAKTETVATDLALPDHLARELVERLEDAGVVVAAAVPAGQQPAYLPARPIDTISIAQIFRKGSLMESPEPDAQLTPVVARVLQRVRALRAEAVGELTLADLLTAPQPAPAAAGGIKVDLKPGATI